jgi:central glycolytic genes regulator
MMTPHVKNHKITFVPARGGLGENVKNQANTICAKMAERSSQDYRLLHVPDQLSDDTYRSMIEEPLIQNMLHLIRSSNIILHGIGEAMTMAKRRQTSESDLNKIKNGHAVGEAFGYYFDQNGKIVHKVKTIGIQLDDLNHNKYVIAVAGGSTKAKAIKAFLNQARNSILITDEGAAKELARDLIF